MVNLNNAEKVTYVRSIERGYAMPEHVHESHAMLLLPMSATMTISDEESQITRPVEPQFFYFVDAGIPHRTRSNRERQDHLAVYLNAEWQKVVLRESGLVPRARCRSGIWRLTDTGLDLTRILARHSDQRQPFHEVGRSQKIAELLAEVCLALSQTQPPTSLGHPSEHGSALILEALELLRRNLADPPAVDVLAQRLEVSRRHLTRVFRERTGRSIGQFLRHERYSVARRLLVETEWTVQQVAAVVGIENAANFATGFKRQFGVSPSEFRIRRAAHHGPQAKAG